MTHPMALPGRKASRRRGAGRLRPGHGMTTCNSACCRDFGCRNNPPGSPRRPLRRQGAHMPCRSHATGAGRACMHGMQRTALHCPPGQAA